MKIKSYFFLIAILCSFVAAGTGPKIKSKVTTTRSSVDAIHHAKANGTVRILAILVEFQKDKDDLTIGDGTFASIYKQDYTGKKILDPLPHDAAYFAAHLSFANNYFSKVSNGNLNVSYTVLPQVITLDTVMRRYSPAVSIKSADSLNFKPIGDMMTEAWTKAANANPSVDFSQYDLFAIFHAGVGRDVSMPGSLGNELDIPSVYLDLNAMRKFYGASYQGIPVAGGTFYIKNSMILPQTENRETDSYGKTYLTQITINGLIVSSIGSFLGLPDLFDTKTGTSAIGRFGLMDGQSIFAYNGAFPPAPCAWEKIQLGWASPVVIAPQDSVTLRLTASMASKGNDTTIIRVPVTADEYFLLENRNRDTKKDGASVSLLYNGSTAVKYFPRDTTGFYSSDIDSLYGVVVDIDEPDWAVPGSGILIWHIDQAVINAYLASDEINNDKTHRGVNLMEAGGAQAIGESFTDILGDQLIGEGSAQDLWYKSNTADLYKNVFDDSSFPNSKSNSGASSLLTFRNFSDSANVMTFSLLSMAGGIHKDIFKQLSLPSKQNMITVAQSGATTEYLVQSGDSLYLFNKSLALDGLLPDFGSRQVLSAGSALVGVSTSTANLTDISATGNKVYPVSASGSTFSCDPVISSQGGASDIYLGTAAGKVLHYTFSNSTPQLVSNDATDDVSAVSNLMKWNGSYAAVRQQGSGSGASYTLWNGTTKVGAGQGTVNDVNGTVLRSGEKVLVLLINNTTFHVYGNNFSIINLSLPDPIQNFAIVDVRRDGNPYLVFHAGTKLYAYNLRGALADNFPVTIGSRTGISRKPSAVITADSSVYLYALADNGLHIVSGKTGHETPYSPLALTGAANSQNVFYNANGQTYCATVDTAGNLTVWSLLGTQGTILYTGLNGDLSGSRVGALTSTTQAASAFMPSQKTYNYPNPVYGKVTYFRFYVTENANVVVKIFDLSGDYVGQLTGYGQGGMDNEIPWDVSHIQSGVYMAHLEATGVSGQKAHSVIKVAVIK